MINSKEVSFLDKIDNSLLIAFQNCLENNLEGVKLHYMNNSSVLMDLFLEEILVLATEDNIRYIELDERDKSRRWIDRSTSERRNNEY